MHKFSLIKPPNFWANFQRIFFSWTFKNRPLWSHCRETTTTTTPGPPGSKRTWKIICMIATHSDLNIPQSALISTSFSRRAEIFLNVWKTIGCIDRSIAVQQHWQKQQQQQQHWQKHWRGMCAMGITVWPDLTRFCHFGINLNVCQFYEGLFRIWQKLLPTLVNFENLQFGNFYASKWTNNENYKSPLVPLIGNWKSCRKIENNIRLW